jgi:DNA polymerase IV
MGHPPLDARARGSYSASMSAGPDIILHVDMDAFFAAIEQRDRPELRGLPVLVGATPQQRGVVATASYEARRYGIHSAMPSRTAAQRCPQAIFVAPRHDHYEAVSAQVMAILQRFTPEVEPVSIDEAFMDISGVAPGLDAAREIALRIKATLRADLALTGSVGLAPNKFLAKLASDMQKPDGLTVAPFTAEAIPGFLAPLPVQRIWGVGPATAEILQRRGMRTIGDIQQRPLDDLVRILGPTAGPHVYRLAFGLDDRRVDATPQEEKSISHEETFAQDISDRDVLRRCLFELVEKVGRRLRRSGRRATSVQIKLRFADFRTISRQQSLPTATSADRDLLRCAAAILERTGLPQPVRLIGFGVSGLREPGDDPESRQPRLFADPGRLEAARNAALDQAVDELRNRFGETILRRGRW